MSQEEEDAYEKIQKENEREILESTSQKEVLNTSTTLDTEKKSTDTTGVTGELVKAKGGVAFDVHFKSTVPKLPPIYCTYSRSFQDHEKWKGMN